MKQILTIAFMLTGSVMFAQDTLCVMMCLDEVIYFDYQTSKIKTRFYHTGDFELPVRKGEVMCLHFSDEKKRFRDVTTTFENGDHIHNTFNSEDNVVFSKENWGNVTIHISEPRRRR
jgi:hypothetical protein|tara:strand:+ start:857 stop:1207 length:351 start_codon:yes stop_codon:yes gene_type:complete